MVEEREAFVEAQPELDTPHLVFVDESGVDVAMSRTHGWAPPGVTPVIERPARGRRISLIGAIALDGCRALRQVDGYVDGDEFIAFLKEDLGPNLCPGDIVVLDGPSIHKVAGVAEAVAERGATLLYLPAYTPELNAIEFLWGWLKKLLRDAPRRKLSALRARVDELWKQVTAKLCTAWIRHCGYASTSAST